MRFCVLGPLEAYADERSVAVGGGRQRALLAILLVHADEVVSRDRLIEELWTGDPSPSRPQSLDVYLSRLRRAFREVGAGDVLVTRAPGYVLHVEETDARRFEALAAEGREALAAGEAERAARVLAEALALWRGAAYAEVADEPWARAVTGTMPRPSPGRRHQRMIADLTAAIGWSARSPRAVVGLPCAVARCCLAARSQSTAAVGCRDHGAEPAVDGSPASFRAGRYRHRRGQHLGDQRRRWHGHQD